METANQERSDSKCSGVVQLLLIMRGFLIPSFRHKTKTKLWKKLGSLRLDVQMFSNERERLESSRIMYLYTQCIILPFITLCQTAYGVGRLRYLESKLNRLSILGEDKSKVGLVILPEGLKYLCKLRRLLTATWYLVRNLSFEALTSSATRQKVFPILMWTEFEGLYGKGYFNHRVQFSGYVE